MKNLTLSLFATFFALCTFGQSSLDPIQSPSSQMFLRSSNNLMASSQSTHYYTDFASFARRDEGGDEGKCAKFKKMKTIGIIVASVGGGLLITGIALEAVAAHDATNAYYNGYTYVAATTDIGLIAGGGVCIAFGLVGVGAGVPLAVIGSVKSHKYCGGGRSYMELKTNGNNLALNF
jgi:hypothetical protein